ncbi:MAG: F0F1 ATP synthase subunit delta, partial [bacterium]|nr:F0F1 ATP synthase subunit delta [bacterium]
DCYSRNKLSEKETKAIIKFLEKELKKEIELNEIVDASYIGIKIVYNNKTIDYTLESRINNMRLSI